MAQYRYKLALLVALAAPACAPAGDEGPEALDPVAERDLAAIADNGTNLNGTNLNGTNLNGTNLNGTNLNGTNLNGTNLNGTNLNGTNLNGSELVGTLSGSSVRGTDLIGAELQGQLSTGGTLVMHIDGARTAGGIWFYTVSYETASGDQPLCGLDGGGAPVEAIAFSGRWDYRQGVSGGGAWINDSSSITFGCRGATLAKCAEIGYKPWANGPGGVPLRDHHQACTRMMRADYCGDGTSWTVTGTAINVYDGLGIQTDTESWAVEAEWTANGARSVKTSGSMRYQLLGAGTPSCISSLASSSTGNTANFSTGTLLMNEY
jgi:hypothetical protein